MKKIVIQNPCSEDWNKMTPTEKGAFCKKCNLEVIDFTSKTALEIKSILTDRIGQKTCGHIGRKQLEFANSAFFNWENQAPKILKSKFLYACFLAFGMTLFTGCDHEQVVGEMETVDGGMEILTGDTIYSPEIDTTSNTDSTNHHTMGEMSIESEN